MVTGVNNNPSEYPEKDLKQANAEDKSYSSVFDINKNGKIDSSDFSIADLNDTEIAGFLKENDGKSWSEKLESFIKPFLDKSNSKNLQATNGKHQIVIQDNKIIITNADEKTEISLNTVGEVKKEDIQNLLNVISSLTPSEFEDFKKEINGINLNDDVFLKGLGFFNYSNDSMDLSTDPNVYGVVKTTFVHELGHGVSLRYKNAENKGNIRNRNEYFYDDKLNEAFGGGKKFKEFFASLKDKYKKTETGTDYGDGYAIRNVNEFFAEYYLYKKEGYTAHGSEKLFEVMENSKDKDEQKLLKIMDKTMKFSKKDEKLRKK